MSIPCVSLLTTSNFAGATTTEIINKMATALVGPTSAEPLQLIIAAIIAGREVRHRKRAPLAATYKETSQQLTHLLNTYQYAYYVKHHVLNIKTGYS